MENSLPSPMRPWIRIPRKRTIDTNSTQKPWIRFQRRAMHKYINSLFVNLTYLRNCKKKGNQRRQRSPKEKQKSVHWACECDYDEYVKKIKERVLFHYYFHCFFPLPWARKIFSFSLLYTFNSIAPKFVQFRKSQCKINMDFLLGFLLIEFSPFVAAATSISFVFL